MTRFHRSPPRRAPRGAAYPPRPRARIGTARPWRTLALALPLWVAAAAVPWIDGGHARAAERPPLVTAESEAAVERGLAYLARTQSRNGSWVAMSSQPYPCTMTSLAGVALMAGGHTPSEGEYAMEVRRAVDFILSCARRDGLIAARGQEQRSMYGHGFSMLFLAQALGMETSPVRQRQVQAALRRAVTLTVRSQSKDGGWYYYPNANTDEGSVTITQIQGLRACRNAGIKVPKGAIEKAIRYIVKCQNDDGGISYSMRNRGRSYPAISAAAVATLYNAGEYDSPAAKKALGYCEGLLRNQKQGRGFGGHQYYSDLYLSQAMWLAGDKHWKIYFPDARKRFVGTQNGDGSWNGDFAGQVYGTAIACIVLQLPYQTLPIVQR